MSIHTEIEGIREQFTKEISNVSYSKDLEQIKNRYFGKKGLIQGLMKQLKDCSQEERPQLGKLINDLKQDLQKKLDTQLLYFSQKELEENLKQEAIDVTLPGRKSFLGKRHPVKQIMQQMLDVFSNMGFAIEIGPDVDSDYYNFEALNFSPDHPAREMQDTFYLSSHMLLRTHTTNVQIRLMEKTKPPIRSVVPGRVFRNETISARSHVFFHQIDGLYIDKNVSLADLLATMEQFYSKLFQKEMKTRFRPSYFPFVEPGMEVDIHCTFCTGKGCRICKETGWLEVAGAGMVHPEVLKAGGVDPEEYSGYAWGMGIERLALLLYGIDDIRRFTENDERFLAQFS